MLVDVVVYELVHMWFGDLVTMCWWNGIWLNEAFVMFMEVLVVDVFCLVWDCWTVFSFERIGAFEVDGLRIIWFVEFVVVLLVDVDGMFDVLIY